MSKCIVPNWHLENQRQEPAEEGRNRSSHVQNQQQNLAVPMSNYEVAELTWEKGNLTMHGLGGLARAAPAKPAWAMVGDTLESIVHQATQHKEDLYSINYHQNQANVNSTVASSTGTWAQNSREGPPTGPNYTKKRISEPGPPRTQQCSCNISDLSASASATVCREIDATALTLTSSDSPGSLKTKSRDEDSALCGRPGIQDEDLETKVEIRRSGRRNRAAAIHNQSERRRRDKINQKLKALQKLVPNSSKTDKASMLDEVIEYLKLLQAQLQLMSIRNMPQMMMPLGMQQHHLQMALLARMGMGLGMGMGILDMSPVPRPNPQPIPPMPHPSNTAAASAASFVPPPFMVPRPMATHASPNPTANGPIPMHNPFSTFLTQSMNVDFYNKMAQLYGQQVNQPPTQVNAPAAHMNLAQCD